MDFALFNGFVILLHIYVYTYIGTGNSVQATLCVMTTYLLGFARKKLLYKTYHCVLLREVKSRSEALIDC